MPKRAVLLVNLGSPDSTAVPDVRRYLEEFLGDERVIDIKPRWLAKFVVNVLICPRRAPKSAEAYKEIWTEDGSPLITTSKLVRDKLAADLGPDLPVYLAMRYGSPSIPSVLEQIKADGIEEILLFPQYPHYAMSSWETVVVKVYQDAARIAPALKIDSVQPFYEDADYIEALHAVTRPYLDANPGDYVLFSYHGIPERHLRKGDASKAHCTLVKDCCDTCSAAHAMCYKAQITKTTRALVRRAGLPDGQWSISFQSRLAGEPWLTPYTDKVLEELPAKGVKRLLVMTPAFVADCLETLEEIAGEGKEEYLHAGGEFFQHIPCLNDQPPYIGFLAGRVRAWAAGATPTATKAAQTAHTLAGAAV
ncbi:MAG: ferrochelatase [Verrucomicrobiota bacterium]